MNKVSKDLCFMETCMARPYLHRGIKTTAQKRYNQQILICITTILQYIASGKTKSQESQSSKFTKISIYLSLLIYITINYFNLQCLVYNIYIMIYNIEPISMEDLKMGLMLILSLIANYC